MKIEKITYEQLFPLPQPFANVRLSMEITIGSKEDPAKVYELAKEKVEAAFKTMFPPVVPVVTDFNNGAEHPIQIGKTSKETATDRMIAAINSCTVLDRNLGGLLSFEKLVSGNPDFQSAYNKKMRELKND